jgi:hypothetical protein
MEKASLDHVKAELRYRKSPKALNDAILDRAKRAESDKANGHSVGCSLTKCAADCRK